MTTYGSYPLRTAKLKSGNWVSVGNRVAFGAYKTKWTGIVKELYYCSGRFAVVNLGKEQTVERVVDLELINE